MIEIKFIIVYLIFLLLILLQLGLQCFLCLLQNIIRIFVLQDMVFFFFDFDLIIQDQSMAIRLDILQFLRVFMSHAIYEGIFFLDF